MHLRLLATGAFCALLALPAVAQAQAIINSEPNCCAFKGDGIDIRLCVPAGVDQSFIVRGLMVEGGGFERHPDFREFAARFGFGTVGGGPGEGAQTYATYAATFFRAFEECGNLLGHPELKNVPITTSGCSFGGGIAYGLAMYRPERTIAFMPRCPVTLIPNNPDAAQRAVPGIFILGGADTNVAPLSANVGPVVNRVRAAGGRWAAIEIQNMGHCKTPPYDMMMLFLEKAIRLRLPDDANPRNGPVTLRPVEESSGWLTDDNSWGSGFTKVYSYADFPGDKRRANTSWVLDQDLAFLHRSLSSRDVVVAINTTNERKLPTQYVRSKEVVGGVMEILGNASAYPTWERIELYMGATKLMETTGGGTTFNFKVPITSPTPVAPAFHVLAYGPGGPKPSRMYDPMVRPAPNASNADAGVPAAGGAGGTQATAADGAAGSTEPKGGENGGGENGAGGELGLGGETGASGTAVTGPGSKGCSCALTEQGSTGGFWLIAIALGLFCLHSRARLARPNQ